MSTQNGSSHAWHLLDERLGAVRERARHVRDRILTAPSGEPSQVRRFASRASDLIKAHPIAAIGTALGFGYVMMRILRR